MASITHLHVRRSVQMDVPDPSFDYYVSPCSVARVEEILISWRIDGCCMVDRMRAQRNTKNQPTVQRYENRTKNWS